MLELIGIIAPMEQELISLLRFFPGMKEKDIHGFLFYSGKIGNKHVIIVKSGVGKVNSAIATLFLIDRFKTNKIFLLGVAGAIDQGLEIGDIVIGIDAVHFDVDITNLGFRLGEIPFTNQVEYTADISLINSLLNNAKKVVRKWKLSKFKHRPKIYCGRIATGDHFVRNKNESNKIFKSFNALCVEMEAASVAQVCYLLRIPFAVIRTISDKSSNKSKIDFANFTPFSANLASKIVFQTIKNL